MKKILIIILLFSLYVPMFAETNNQVAIIYNGRSAVNRETAKYIIKQSSKIKLEYKFKVLKVNSKDVLSEYKNVIILNTGIKNNDIDPVLKSFIDKASDNTNFILLSFVKGQKSLDAKLLVGEDAINGVDGISSASIYKGGQNNDYEWFGMLVELLNGPIIE